MRITVLRTHTSNCPAIYEPLSALGHEVSVIIYDLMTLEALRDHLVWMVDETRPDWVLMIGFHRGSHVTPLSAPIPSTEVLAKIGSRHPLVHLCCDGAEVVWWPEIQGFYDHGN